MRSGRCERREPSGRGKTSSRRCSTSGLGSFLAVGLFQKACDPKKDGPRLFGRSLPSITDCPAGKLYDVQVLFTEARRLALCKGLEAVQP